LAGGDAAEVVGIVDDRGEEVDGLHQRQPVAEQVDAGVVGGRGADEQVRVVLLGQLAHDRQQVAGAELAAAAGAMGQ
jgi:hypothetical protein